MTKPKRNVAAHLPKKAPKKTGKRGVKPLDPDEDFNSPNRREPEQGQLLATPEAEKPPAVQNGKCMAHFVDFHFTKDKERNGVALLDFSFPLDDSHKDELPREFIDAWNDLRKGHHKEIKLNGVEPQNVELSIAADGKTDLELTAADIAKASVAFIAAKGKGKTQKITRLQFRLRTSLDKEVANFCEKNFDELTWLRMEPTQRSLGT